MGFGAGVNGFGPGITTAWLCAVEERLTVTTSRWEVLGELSEVSCIVH